MLAAVVVAQLVEQSLPTPEVCSSNPVIGEFLNRTLFSVNFIVQTKIKKKRPVLAHFFKKKNIQTEERYSK